jgi:hypothetical protein
LGFIAEAMWLLSRKKYIEAAKLLESHMNDQELKPSAKIGILSWIGECYLKAGNTAKAGTWFELAGKAALDCKDLPQSEKEQRAIVEFEQAISHYQAVDDMEGMSRVASLKYALNAQTNWNA